MANNVTRFPVVARKVPTAGSQVAADTLDPEVAQNLAIVRREVEYAARKLKVVAGYHEQMPWAVRLLEHLLSDFKETIGKDQP